MEKKQTAVEWLIEHMLKQGYLDFGNSLTFEKLNHLEKLTKDMEKEQIIEAHYEGQCKNQEGYPKYISEQYYNKTYGQE